MGCRDFEPEEELERRRRSLVPILEAGVAEASAPRAEARLAAGVLAAVAGRPRALKVLLAAHSLRLKRAQQQLLKPQNTGGIGCLCKPHELRRLHSVISSCRQCARPWMEDLDAELHMVSAEPIKSV